MSKSLDEVLSYEFPDLLESFRRNFAVSEDESREVFEDLKRWLWLAERAVKANPVMLDGMWIIDEMWHLFITYTVDYSEFCETMFGRFLHHVPVPHQQRQAHREDFWSAGESDPLEPWRSEVRSQLGAEVEDKWMSVYPQTYPPETRLRLSVQAGANRFVESQRHSTRRLLADGESLDGSPFTPKCGLPACTPSCSSICSSVPKPRP